MRDVSTMAAVVAACALLVCAAPAAADLLRCKGPDGKTIYTDDKSLCPGSEPFEPKGEIQGESPAPAARETAEDPLESRRRRAEERQRAYEAEEAEARVWREKKSDLQASLEKATERRVYYEQFLTLCNRGGMVVARDDAGIKRRVKCTTIREQHASLEQEEQRIQDEIAGLPEACRRAGCQPGWIR